MRDGGAEAGQQEQTGGKAGTFTYSLTQFMFQTLLQLEFVAATAGRECFIQGVMV